jgi:hypothetical protein
MSMIRKSHLSIAFAGLALFAGSQAFACSTSLWGAGLTGGAGGAQSALGGVVAGQPNGGGGGTATRYSGLCGLRATAVGAMVQDGSMASEATLKVRFYVHVNMTSGTPVVYRVGEGAPDAGGTPMISIQYNRTNQQFEAVNRTGTVSTIGAAGSAVNNNFYHVHLSWTRATGALDVVVQGAGSSTPLPTANLTGFSAVGSAENYAQLGFVAGTGTGTLNFDAYESRRSTDIVRLCRADANASNSISVADRAAVTAEIGGTLAPGQPDANESGGVSVTDRAIITSLIGAGATCAPNAH